MGSTVLAEIQAHEHEQVSFFQDASRKLIAIIAVHDTTMGPALGGCRMQSYPSLDAALLDVLRLSEGMTYKNALAGLPIGGGKSVIIADRTLRDGRAELFRTFGGWVNSLGGRYITAEDMGTSVQDMNAVLEVCPHVTGRDPKVGGGGDPSPHTARGVFLGMKACLERAFGSGEFNGRHVAIQGCGNVGHHLLRLLVEAGARVSCADTRVAVLEKLREQFDFSVVPVEQVHGIACDVFAPCAVGGIINPETVPQLQCKIIAGGANNQIAGSGHIGASGVEAELQRRGILYAPDFAINSGGVILCVDELEPGGYTPARVAERVSQIYHTVGKILDESRSSGVVSGEVAVAHAKARIAEKRRAAK